MSEQGKMSNDESGQLHVQDEAKMDKIFTTLTETFEASDLYSPEAHEVFLSVAARTVPNCSGCRRLASAAFKQMMRGNGVEKPEEEQHEMTKGVNQARAIALAARINKAIRGNKGSTIADTAAAMHMVLIGILGGIECGGCRDEVAEVFDDLAAQIDERSGHATH